MNAKTSYAVCVMLVLLRNLGKNTDSISQLILYADKQMKKLGIKDNLSESTKYLTIKELLATGVLIGTKDEVKLSIGLSPEILEYFIKGKQ